MDHQEHIDHLLERYLTLLDRYSTLRASLASLHGNMYQSIARANFSAERGVRYGQDYYNERMQAARRIAFSPVVEDDDGAVDDDGDGDRRLVGRLGWTCHAVDGISGSEETEKPEPKEKQEKEEDEKKEQSGGQELAKKQKPAGDPIRWFGFMVPAALREAQARAVRSVTEVIPELVMVTAQMREVEIEIRRARKRRAKAEAAAEKGAQGAAEIQENAVDPTINVEVVG